MTSDRVPADARPLEIVSWPCSTRGDAPVYWIIERTPIGPEAPPSFAILGPYTSWSDAGEGLRREVERRSGLMLRQCAYCRRVLGATPCLPRFSGLVTHGTCPDCDGRLRERLGLASEGGNG